MFNDTERSTLTETIPKPKRLAAMVAGLTMLSACTTIQRAPFNRAQQAEARVVGIPDARFWGDAPDAPRRMAPPIASNRREVAMLALSGGGENGAYGAGLLNGWTAARTRPEFAIVTGVSTGALIAPFAFLGPREDGTLARIYTTISARDIYRARFPLVIPASPSAATTKPLARLIAAEATDAIIDAVGREHARGRRLFVGTANLDAQRTVIWDMGVIASARTPSRYALFRQVLLASSSIPALFPPVLIDADAAGIAIREMHVDGGTTAQLLTVPSQLVRDDAPAPDSGKLRLYVIVNNKLGGDFRIVKPRLGPIAQSSLYSLVSVSYLYARDNGIDFNLSYIGNAFPSPGGSPFDPVYMRRLYKYCLARGQRAGSWAKRPPGERERNVIPASDTPPPDPEKNR